LTSSLTAISISSGFPLAKLLGYTFSQSSLICSFVAPHRVFLCISMCCVLNAIGGRLGIALCKERSSAGDATLSSSIYNTSIGRGPTSYLLFYCSSLMLSAPHPLQQHSASAACPLPATADLACCSDLQHPRMHCS
jgi:hypothetical protein